MAGLGDIAKPSIRAGADLPKTLRTINNLSSGMENNRRVAASWAQQLSKNRGQLGALGRESSGAAMGIRSLGVALIAGIGAFKAYSAIKEMTLLAARVEVLDVVVKQVGRTAGYSARQIDQVVEGVKAMGITTQAARIATTRMIWAQLDMAKATKLARVAQDAAVIANINSSFTLQQLIYGIVTYNPRILRTYGIMINMEQAIGKFAKQLGISTEEVTVAQKQQVALNEVLEFGSRITGAYETSMTKAGKQWVSMPRYIEEMQRVIGEHFLPVMTLLVKKMTQFYETVQNNKEAQNAIREFAQVVYTGLQVVIGVASFLLKHWRQVVFFGVAMITVKAAALIVGAMNSIGKAFIAGSKHWVLWLQLASALAAVLTVLSPKMKAFASSVLFAGAAIVIFNKWLLISAGTSGILKTFIFSTVLATKAMQGFSLALASTPWGLVIGLVAAALGALLIPALMKTRKEGSELRRTTTEMSDAAIQLKRSIAEETKAQVEAGERFRQAYRDFNQGKISMGALTEAFDAAKKVLPDLIGKTDTLREAFEKTSEELDKNLIPKYKELYAIQLKMASTEISQDIQKRTDAEKEFSGQLRETIFQHQKFADSFATIPAQFESEKDALEYMENVLPQSLANDEKLTNELKAAFESYGQTLLNNYSSIREELGKPVPEGISGKQWLEDMQKRLDDAKNAYDDYWGTLDKGKTPEGFNKFLESIGMTGELTKGLIEKYQAYYKDVYKVTLASAEEHKSLRAIIEAKDLLLKKEVELYDLVTNRRISLENEYASAKPLTKEERERLDVLKNEIEMLKAKGETDPYEKKRKEETLKIEKERNEALNEYQSIQKELKALGEPGVEADLNKLLAQNTAIKNLNDSIIAKKEEIGKILAGLNAEEQANWVSAHQDEIAAIENMQVEYDNLLKERGKFSSLGVKIDDKGYQDRLALAAKYFEKYQQLEETLRIIIAGINAEETEDIKKAEQERVNLHIQLLEAKAKLDYKYLDELRAVLEAAIGDLESFYGPLTAEQEKFLAELKLKLRDVEKAEKEAAQKSYEVWQKKNKEIVLLVQGATSVMTAAYETMVNSWSDLEMTGKKRREQIWAATLRSFSQFIGRMVRELLLKKILLRFLFSLGGPFAEMAQFEGFVPGKQSGGYTGKGDKSKPAGVYHFDEWVVPSKGVQYDTNRHLLALMTQGQDLGRMFQTGFGIQSSAFTSLRSDKDPFFNKRMERLAERTEKNTRQPGSVNVDVRIEREPVYRAVEDQKRINKALTA